MTNTYLKTATRASALCTGLLCAASAHATLTITDIGRYDFSNNNGSVARELSGIANNGGSTYSVIGDKDAVVYTLALGMDNSSGQITSAAFSPGSIILTGIPAVPLPPGDREAIAIQNGHFLIVNETGPRIEAYNTLTGLENGPNITTAQPGFGVYASSRPNKSWESLTVYHTNTSVILTANEDALTVDGPAAGFSQGAMVRIQAAFADASNSTASAIGQFAYPIDAINGDNPFVTGETSGLVELLALPSGQVLAMERAVGATGYRIRIYEINGDIGSDISSLSGLNGLTPGVDYKPLSKTLLWENTFSVLTNSNFEGIALGPELNDGGQALVLIADNASGPVLPIFGQQWTAQDQSLYTVKLEDFSSENCFPEGCLAGDLDHTGFVGINDLNIILSRWNEVVFPGSSADPNIDGFVGIADLNIVLGNWNAGTPPPSLSSIPEPASAVIGGLFSAYLLLGRLRPGIN